MPMSTATPALALGPGLTQPPPTHTIHRACLGTTSGSSSLSQESESYLGLRVAALFVILVGSTLGALFPVFAVSASGSFARYFGSGVIIGTAFIHLLAPGIEALASSCLTPKWRQYPYALGLCLLSILSTFAVEIATLRYAEAYRVKAGPERRDLSAFLVSFPRRSSAACMDVDHPAPEGEPISLEADFHSEGELRDMSARLVGVVILEFGAVLHSVLIGLTLAANSKFKVLFAVLVTHQVFEGLGLGSRLASVPGLPLRVRVGGAVVFGLSTPVGMAVGLAVRASYSPDSDADARIVSGVLDSLSAGILIYTGLVELLAREMLLNEELMKGPARKLLVALGWVLLGCCLMALLGKWL